MSAFAAPIAEQIWDMKYRLKQPGGEVVDKDIQGTWTRIAKALASVESDPSKYEADFYKALEDFKFLPAGRIIAGAFSAALERRPSSWAIGNDAARR